MKIKTIFSKANDWASRRLASYAIAGLRRKLKKAEGHIAEMRKAAGVTTGDMASVERRLENAKNEIHELQSLQNAVLQIHEFTIAAKPRKIGTVERVISLPPPRSPVEFHQMMKDDPGARLEEMQPIELTRFLRIYVDRLSNEERMAWGTMVWVSGRWAARKARVQIFPVGRTLANRNDAQYDDG